MKDRNFKDDLKSEKMKRGGSYMRQNTASSFNIGSAPDDSNRRLQRSRTAFCLSDGMAIGSGGHRTISPIFAELALRKESGGGGEELFQSASFNFSPPKISGKDLSVPLEDALSFMSTPAKDLPKPIPRAPTDPLATRRPNIFDLINGGTAAAKESNNQNVADNRMPQWGKSGKSGHAAVRSWSQRF
jgi:hypothetical protein